MLDPVSVLAAVGFGKSSDHYAIRPVISSSGHRRIYGTSILEELLRRRSSRRDKTEMPVLKGTEAIEYCLDNPSLESSIALGPDEMRLVIIRA